MLERRPALGKGLSALIPDVPEPARQGAVEVDIDLHRAQRRSSRASRWMTQSSTSSRDPSRNTA